MTTSMDNFCHKYNDSVVRKINIFLPQSSGSNNKTGVTSLD